MDPETEKIFRKSKPRACPVCGFSPVASIQYGKPVMTPELEKKLQEGRIAIGGCCVSQDSPDWMCSSCETPIYKELSKLDRELLGELDDDE